MTVVPISVAVELVEELYHRGFRDMFRECSATTTMLAPAVAKLLYHRGEEFVEAVKKSQADTQLPRQYTVIRMPDDRGVVVIDNVAVAKADFS